MARTQKEIDRQINGLKEQRRLLPNFTLFGDNNWEQIDAQLDVLEGKKTPDDFYEDETSEDFNDGDNNTYFEAVKADEWFSGASDEDLFDLTSLK